MKLYVFPPSPNAFLPTLVAAHLGLDIELETVNLPAGDTRTPSYSELNPNQLMPTLVDGDFVLWESTAISQYLCSKSPGQTLWPSEPRAQADVSRWMCWRLAHWGPACGILTFQNLVKPILGDTSGPDPAELERGNEQVTRFATVLDEHLKRRQWLAGDALTLADFAVGVWLRYKDQAKLPIADKPELLRWFDAVSSLESWQRTQPQLPPVAATA